VLKQNARTAKKRLAKPVGVKASDIEFWTDQLAASYQILPMDTPRFRRWARRIMDRKPDRLLEDAMIAATARVHQSIIATRKEAISGSWTSGFSTHSRPASFPVDGPRHGITQGFLSEGQSRSARI
jgi:hypothetical protein